ncbi:unnamed protein product [Pieris brassicae]|uniref:Zinc finger PHD-type domain-containing protein n=1 Tax=Pieris brassicae TaxID=7116 RepID=A0A9P0SX57_PIEBR|nr:unnamed protein product [Pieris brassicae]
MPKCIACSRDLDISKQKFTKCFRGCHNKCVNIKSDVVIDSWTCPPCSRREHRGQSTSPDNVQATTTRRNKKDTGLCDRCVSKDDLQKLIAEGINQAIDSKLDHFESLKMSLFVEIREEINSIINPFLKETECLREEGNKLKNYIQNNNSIIDELRCQINNQQQWNRLNNLAIVGLPQTKNESTRALVKTIAKHADVVLRDNEIEFANRIQPKQSMPGKAKTVVVRLNKRQNIIWFTKKTGNTSDIGMSGDSKRFYVNEHLTPDNKHLLKEAKSLAIDKKFKFVRNCGFIYAETKSCYHKFRTGFGKNNLLNLLLCINRMYHWRVVMYFIVDLRYFLFFTSLNYFT